MITPAHRFTPPPSVTAQIARLPQLPMAEIKALWRELYGRQNPTHNRQFLERRIAYKLQENAFRTVDESGLLERNARRIQALIETVNAPKRDHELRLVPGTVLTREYRGIEHHVAVTQDGQYEYQGRRYPTQQFNTTTSMGRLMLNILLSFAQFEREVTGERIRDKIAASKRKGLWMGGIPPLGYDVENRRLIPNAKEAKTVRHIFERFIKLGSSTQLVKELRLDGVTSKAWTTQEGRMREGKPIDKSLIYKILSNRVYLGEIRHRDRWYAGEHPPIVESSLWDAAQAILASNPRVRANDTRARVPFLLKGIVQGSDGRALTPWFTRKKNGRLYRYYLPVRKNKEHAGASGLPRLPAGELEAAVLEQLRRVLRSPAMVAGVTERVVPLDPFLDEAQVTVAMTRMDAIWEQLFPAEQQHIVRLLVEKVIVSPDDLEVRFRPNGIEVLALELQPEPVAEHVEEAVA
jgi:site-specific DNA recombinase